MDKTTKVAVNIFQAHTNQVRRREYQAKQARLARLKRSENTHRNSGRHEYA